MAIRDIVTGGFGNGTFSPGVSKVVTDGFGIEARVSVVVEYLELTGAIDSYVWLRGADDSNLELEGAEDGYLALK